jgi:hypothetical protein
MSNITNPPKDRSAKPVKVKTLRPRGSGGRTRKLNPRRKGG